MKVFTKVIMKLFVFLMWWSSIIIASIDDNNFYLAPELQSTHEDFIIKENNLNVAEDKYMINVTSSNTIGNLKKDISYTEDLKKICHAQVNEFNWKCPIISDDGEEKILHFRTIFNQKIYSSNSFWYLKSINKIDIVKMDPTTYVHQIEFLVSIDEQKITLNRLYPTYPKISGFEILQFIANLAFQCKFVINVLDASDVSTVYSKLYGKTYYEYHLKGGIDLNQNFIFKNIVVKKNMFLDCFGEKIGNLIETLSQLFYTNIQTCENLFVPVEFCPITFQTQRIFYQKSLKICIDWPLIMDEVVQATAPSLSHRFEITSEDITHIMKKKQNSNHLNFIKIYTNQSSFEIQSYDKIKTQIFDTLGLMKLFSKLFELCFFELEKRKPDPNPEDIFKIYLRGCVIPNINLFLKYF